MILYVLAELDEVVGDSFVEQVHTFADVHLTRNAVLDERLGGAAKGHADVHGRLAGFVEVLHFVTAIAGTDAPVRGSADDFAGSFVVQDGERAVARQGVLVDKDAAQLGFAAGEEVADEIFFDVEVLVEKLGEQLLVVCVADAHHGELKEASHGRRQNKDLLAVDFHVEQHAAGGKGLEDVLGFGGGFLPDFGGGGDVEWLDGKQRDQGRLIAGEENLQYPEEKLGGRRALGKKVEPVGERLVAIPEGHVGHGRPLALEGLWLILHAGAKRDAGFRFTSYESARSCSH